LRNSTVAVRRSWRGLPVPGTSDHRIQLRQIFANKSSVFFGRRACDLAQEEHRPGSFSWMGKVKRWST